LTIPLLIGSGIFVASVVIQVLAIVVSLGFLRRRDRLGKFDDNLVVATGALSGGMLIIFLGHLLQVALWALLFVELGEFKNYATAFYHSMVNFTSLGYGDLVMSEKWRLLGAMEAAGGILMFGISTGVGLAVVTTLIQRRGDRRSETHREPPP
jgi:voltage-gated potassium channel Kch